MSNYSELITYSVTDAALAELKSQYGGLRVLGIDDEEGYARCKEARKIVRDTRLQVEARRKELKREALDFEKAVDAEAKRITAKVVEIEEHLVSQLSIVEEEKKRREEEAKRAAQERINLRLRRMAEVGAALSFEDAARLSDDEFAGRLAAAEIEHERQQSIREQERQRLEQLEREAAEREKALAEEREKTRQLEAEARRMQEEAAARDREAARVAEEGRRRAEAEAAELRRQREQEAAQEQKRKEAEEAAARAKVADELLFNAIKRDYDTLEKAWVEIARLRKLLDAIRGEE